MKEIDRVRHWRINIEEVVENKRDNYDKKEDIFCYSVQRFIW